MERQRAKKKISDDLITCRGNSVQIPLDLIPEILKRLPVKTLARFLCVSKLWSSIIRRRDFIKLFLTETKPERLFFSFTRDEDSFFFSSLQTQNPGEASVATYHMTHPSYKFTVNSSSVHGLICYGTASASSLVVYNPISRSSITLPEFDSQSFVIKHFFCYDPIDGVYKVLCMTGPRLVLHLPDPKLVLQVLTLGNENSWKTIEDSLTHFPVSSSQICINGVSYYEAYAYAYADINLKETVFMSFDVRSEQFDLIKRPGDDHSPLDVFSTMMVRYEGKLAIISKIISADNSMVFWVLEDAAKHEWLKKIFVLPNSWTSLAQCSLDFHRVVNITDAGEFILAPIYFCELPFYVLFYDPKINSVRKVEIQGITDHKLLRCKKRPPCLLSYLFASQVESLLFL